LTGCTTSFSPRPSSASGSRGPWLRRRWQGIPIYSFSRNLLRICCI
jgi:hypothetical protein